MASLRAQGVKNPPAVAQGVNSSLAVLETQEMQVQCLGQKDPLEEYMATHPNILGLEIPCTEEPVGLESKGQQRIRHD